MGRFSGYLRLFCTAEGAAGSHLPTSLEVAIIIIILMTAEAWIYRENTYFVRFKSILNRSGYFMRNGLTLVKGKLGTCNLIFKNKSQVTYFN